MTRSLLYRFNNWKVYFDGAISADIRFLSNLIDHGIDRLNNFPWMPPAIVRQTIRAEFRIMYFIHGSSYVFNYVIIRSLFKMSTECGFIRDGVVELRPLQDESDNVAYPIFSNRISAHQIQIIRHIWLVQNAIWSVYLDNNDDNDDDGEVLRYVITMYGVWAYGPAFVRSHQEADVVAQARRLYRGYKDAFNLRSYLREYKKYSPRRCPVTVSKTVLPDEIARVIVQEPSTHLSKTVLAPVRLTDRTDFYHKLAAFIADNVNVFPMKTISNTYYTYA